MIVIYVSRLMKGHEVRKACSEFRDKEARDRRLAIKLMNKKIKAMAATTA